MLKSMPGGEGDTLGVIIVGIVGCSSGRPGGMGTSFQVYLDGCSQK